MRGNSLDIQKLYIGGNPASGGGNNNLLINGCLRVWQRGQNFSPLTSNHQYTADRWYVSNVTGFGARRVAHNSAAGLYTNQMLLIRLNGDTATDVMGAYQRLEPYDTFRLRGKTVTFSCYVRCGVSYSGGTNGVDIRIATVDDEDTTITLATGGLFHSSTTGYTQEIVTLTPTTSLVRHSVTMTVPATAWQLQVAVRWQPVGTASDTADWVGVEQLQLEVGAEPTDFEIRPRAMEENMCRRFYETGTQPRWYMNDAAMTHYYGTVQFLVEKRVTPTVAAASWTYWSSGSSAPFTPTINEITVFRFVAQHTSLTNGRGWVGAGTWTADAEL